MALFKYLTSSLSLIPHSPHKPILILSLHLSTATRPEPNKPNPTRSVLTFLLSTGLTNAQIKTLLSWNPHLLTSDVDKTLQPQTDALKRAGFTGPTLVQIIRSNPKIFQVKTAVLRLQFWRTFFHHNQDHLIQALKRNRNLVSHDIDRRIRSNINFLETLGFSSDVIASIMMRVNGFVLRRPDTVKALIDRTRELGFQHCDGTFVRALSVVGMVKRDTMQRKIELMRSEFGWSEQEISCAFQKHPNFLSLSEGNLRAKMEFLVGEAGCGPPSVAQRPMLLSYSLERRLAPRWLVVKELKAKGLGKGDWDFGSVVALGEEKFLKRFVECYEEEVPGLWKKYIDACGRKI